MGFVIVLWSLFVGLLRFLFFSIWGWAILLLVVLPAVRGRIQTWSRRRSFYHAREAELANPKHAGARFQLGVIHYDGRQLKKALKFFQEAVRISQSHDADVDPKLFQYLGHTLRRLGHDREAIIAYEAGLDDAPESGRGESETGIGASHRRLLEAEPAERWFREAIQRNTSLIEPRVRLASLLMDTGRRDEARTLLAETRQMRIPGFAARRERKWRLALLLFPVARHLF